MGRRTIPRSTRALVYARDGHRCVLCGCSADLSAHHIRPHALGGATTPANLVTVCHSCHDGMEDRIKRALRWVLPAIVWITFGPILRLARLTAPLRRQNPERNTP